MTPSQGAFRKAWSRACGRWSSPSRLPGWQAWPLRCCARARSSRAGSASATSAPAQPVTPRRCSTWRRCPSPSSRPRSCRWRSPGRRRAGARPGCPDRGLGAEFTLADGRAAEVTARASVEPLQRTSGRHGLRLARPGARRRRPERVRSQPVGLAAEVRARLGVLLLQRRVRAPRAAVVRATGTTFEDAVRQQVLAPLGMRNSTFLRGEVPGAPRCLTARGDAPDGARGRLPLHQAPCAELDAALQPGELCRWMVAHFDPADVMLFGAGVRRPAGHGWTPGCST